MLVTALFTWCKSDLRKAFFIVRAIAPLDDAVSPRACFLYQSMNSARFFDRLCKACFSFRMSRVFHRKIHRVIGESYEKGGRLSKALWYTPATVSVVQSAWISEYFQRVRKWIKLILYSKPLLPLMAGSSWISHCRRWRPTGIFHLVFGRGWPFLLKLSRFKIRATVPRLAKENLDCIAKAMRIAPWCGFCFRYSITACSYSAVTTRFFLSAEGLSKGESRWIHFLIVSRWTWKRRASSAIGSCWFSKSNLICLPN